jgi:hypothetical protein
MASALPVEILYQVCDRVDCFLDQVKLLRVCRHWHNALCSKVYSRIEFQNDAPLIPLATTLLKNPRLRPLIKELHFLSSYGAQSPEFGFYDPGVFHGFIEQFMDTEDEEGEWEGRLDVNDVFCWISLILLLVPNLQYLNMRWANRRLDQRVPWIVDKMANRSLFRAVFVKL